jgi:hypothetical protein
MGDGSGPHVGQAGLTTLTGTASSSTIADRVLVLSSTQTHARVKYE